MEIDAEGNEVVPFFFYYPSIYRKRTKMEPIIADLERKINNLIAADPGLFLVEVRVKPTNNIKVFIDGDQGVRIDQLSQFNRRLYRQLEEENMFPNGDFSLELSSPGLDEPLKSYRQYLKNIGRDVEVFTTDGRKIEGKLLSVGEREIVVEEQKGNSNGKTKQNKAKKIEPVQHTIAMETIKSTKIQIKF